MTFLFLIFEIVLFLYDAYIVAPVISSNRASFSLTDNGKSVLNETVVDVLFLILFRVATYSVQFFIMCFKLHRHRAMDNDEPSIEEQPAQLPRERPDEAYEDFD